MSKVLKNIIMYFMSNIVIKSINFLLLPMYLSYLNTSEYGILSSMFILKTIFILFLSFCIDKAIFRFYYEEKNRKEFIGNVFITLILIGTVVSFLSIFVFKKYINMFFKTIPFYPYYLLTIIISYLTLISSFGMSLLMVQEKAKLFSFINILKTLILFSLNIFFVVVLKKNVIGILMGYLITELIFIPFYLKTIIKNSIFKFNKKIVMNALKYSIPLIPNVLFVWIIDLSDRVFIERYLTLKQVGIYSLGYKIGEVIILISSSFFNAYNPTFFKIINDKIMSTDNKNLLLKKYNTNFVLIILFVGFLLILFSKYLLFLIPNKDYLEINNVFPFIIIATVISQISGLYNLSIYQLKKTFILTKIMFFSSILNIVLNIYFIKSFAIMGAAISTLITFILEIILKKIYTDKLFKIELFKKEIFLIVLYYFLGFFLNYIEIDYKLLGNKILIVLIFIVNLVYLKKINIKKLFLKLKGE